VRNSNYRLKIPFIRDIINSAFWGISVGNARTGSQAEFVTQFRMRLDATNAFAVSVTCISSIQYCLGAFRKQDVEIWKKIYVIRYRWNSFFNLSGIEIEDPQIFYFIANFHFFRKSDSLFREILWIEFVTSKIAPRLRNAYTHHAIACLLTRIKYHLGTFVAIVFRHAHDEYKYKWEMSLVRCATSKCDLDTVARSRVIPTRDPRRNLVESNAKSQREKWAEILRAILRSNFCEISGQRAATAFAL